MSKNYNKSPKIAVPELEQSIQTLFSQEPNSQYNATQIGEKLRASNNKDSLNHVLQKLVDTGFLAVGKSGRFFLATSANAIKTAKEIQDSEIHKDEKLAIGKVDMTRSGAAYIILDGDKNGNDVFVPAHKVGSALNQDKVQVAYRYSSKGKAEGRVVEIVSRFNSHFIGIVRKLPQAAFLKPLNPNINFEIQLQENPLFPSVDGDKVVVQILEWHNPSQKINQPTGKITAILGGSNVSEAEMQSILLEYGFDLEFPEEVLAENEAIIEEITEKDIKNRLDFRNTTTFTIDPLTAKDFDDALSFNFLENGNYEIGVHIADVSHYVVPKSALDEEAAKRTTSVYLVDRVLPMLPEKLSNGVCSLRPNEDKLTFAAVFEFTPQGEILSEWFGKTIIHSNRRFTYEEVQEVIETNAGDYLKELQILNGFAQKMKRDRFKKGAFNFEAPEVQFKLDETGKPIGVYTKIRKEAHFLVEEFMLLANKQVATFIFKKFKETNKLNPFVYRIHDLPDMEKVANFVQFAKVFGHQLNINTPKAVVQEIGALLTKTVGLPEHDILQQLAIRTMSKAEYSTNNIGHYGLAFDYYSHFTSPIRRYADVLAHRLLYDVLEKNPLQITENKLAEHCKHISQKERKAMEAERASTKYKQAEFIQSQIGVVFPAVINGMTERGIYAEIRENKCEGMINFDNMYERFEFQKDGYHIKSKSKTYKMGDFVFIEVLSVNLIKRQIDFKLLSERWVQKFQPALWEDFLSKNPKHKPTENSPIHTEADKIQTTNFTNDITTNSNKKYLLKPKNKKTE
jgi:ribonuclease R